jgi:hypothetical protein
MKVASQKDIETFEDNAQEIQDGLFTFVCGGRYVLDTCVCYLDNVDMYIIEIYQHDSEEHGSELCNFSHVTESNIYDNYTRIEKHAFTEQAEAYAFHLSKMIELNGF